MTLVRSVGRNTILQITGKSLGTVLGFITVAILQRSLGTAGFGAYSTAMSFMGFFSVIADFGLYLIVLREIAKPGADRERIVGNALTLRIIGAFLILVFGILLSLLFPYGHDIKLGIAILAISFFFIAVQQVLVSVFQHALAMKPVVFGELLGRIVLLAFVYIFALQHRSVVAMCLAVVAGTLANVAIVVFSSIRMMRLRFYADIPYWKYIIKESWPVAISIVLNLLYFRLDTIFLSLFRSLQEVGLYSASYKILEVLISFPSMFIGLVLPILSAFAFIEWDRFKKVFQRAFDALLLAATPIVVGGMILARPIVVLVGGKDFASAAPYFRILLVAVFFLFLSALSGHAVTAIREQRRMVWRYLFVSTLGIASYLVLIPIIGPYGAAIGTVLSESMIMLLGYRVIYKKIGFRPSFSLFGKILGSAAVMGAVIYAIRSMNVIIVAIAGLVVYAGMVIATKAVDRETLKIIFSKN